jgi:lipopolysaccharide transport system permease protein
MIAEEIVIRPNRSWWQLDWRGLVAYRDLLWLLVRRDFVAKYKQTVLGPTWFFLNPLVTTFVFTVVFSRVIGVPTDGVPPMLFYLCGMLGWSYFSAVLGGTGNTLAGNAHLFSKVYFPRLIPPLAVSVSCLIGLSIQLFTFLVFYFIHFTQGTGGAMQPPSWAWLALPLLLAHIALLGLGVGLLMSAATAKYRDLQHVLGFITQLWMYATPVIYPLSRIPEQWRWVANINPMTAVVDGSRSLLLGVGTVDAASYAVSVVVSVVLFFIGVLAYQRTARTFVDTV